MMQARPIPSMVRRIVPSLGSSVDGEALAAARAIGRALGRDGLDFHDLANAIPAGETKSDNVTLEHPGHWRGAAPRGPIPPFDVYSWRRAYTPKQEAEHRARVQFCQERTSLLTDWERGFLNNIARLRGNLSIKQGDRLAAMTDRLDQEARRA